MKVILGMDLGTTGNRVAAFTKDGRVVASAYYEFPQVFPKPGWVEHDPVEILESALRALKEVAGKVGVENIQGLGITNQRETTILWDKKTGAPVYNAIVWQCRRTADLCDALRGSAAGIKSRTGLSLDPYFSATKIRWILDHVPGVRDKAARGEILFGTVDTWMLWNLTKGKTHATEPSNASRTLCLNIQKLSYDAEMLKLFGIPENIFPEVRDSGGLFGVLDKAILGREIPILAILGDQQAAFFAQGGWQEGVVKNTYGTGLFLMAATGKTIPESGSLINTVAWRLRGDVLYAIEGSVFVGGAAIQWLRDGLKIISSAAETEALALSLKSNEGVYFVPALTGLGAPYWDPDARGLLIGLTRGTTPAHFVRAALESLAYQTRDVIGEMKRLTTTHTFNTLRVDGGAVKNNFLMQFQADILGFNVERPEQIETTVLGAAALAGMEAGFWTQEEFLSARRVERVFQPMMEVNERQKLYQAWLSAAAKSLGWAKPFQMGPA